MKFQDIPDAIRKARAALVERWFRADSPEERRGIIQRGVHRAIATLQPADNQHTRALENLSRQAAGKLAQLNALIAEREEREISIAELQNRLAELKLQPAIAHRQAMDIVASLGFDLYSKTQNPKPK